MRTGKPAYVPLTTNLGLKYKQRLLYFPMGFGELGLSCTSPGVDLSKILLLAPQSFVKEGPAPNFEKLVANGQLETPKSSVEVEVAVGDIDVH